MILNFQVMLLGNPNAGKSSLFEALTDACVKIANHSGVTVEQQTACCCFGANREFEFVDLPGIYSLEAHSPEEQVTLDYLEKHPQSLSLFVLDATHLKRNLFLLTQLIEKGHRPIVALTQIDLIKKLGIQINIERLEANLGLQIFPVSAKTREGLKELKVGLSQKAI